MKMKIIGIGILFLFATFYSVNAQSESNVLYWAKNYRLTFFDFKGFPSLSDTTSYNSLSSDSIHKYGAISKSIDVQLKTVNGKTTFKIYAGMQRNLSWIKVKGDTITLKHEQGHFDICEIYARLLRKEIKNAKSLAVAKQLYEKISEEENAEQDRFDKENKFDQGGITPFWSDQIMNRLKELELYQNSILTLPLK